MKDNASTISGAFIISDELNVKPHNSPHSEGSKREFLDRHRWLPIAVLLILPFAVHLPLWLLGRSIDPIWFVSGITHGSQLVPGRPFIDPNVGFTSQALGHLAARDWLHGIVPWWNPYTGIGMPLAGELQPEAFFLPFNLLLLLREGILWQQICMQAMAGLATYALLRELELTRFAALIGGMLFALNGTIAWTPGPAAVYCTIPFLPLLLLGIEKARKRNVGSGPVSVLTIGVAIGWSLLAGFPEPAFISGLFALCWGLYRLVQEPERWPMARRAITGFVLGLMVAAPLLISFVDYIRQSNSFAIHTLGEGSQPWAAFTPTLMPYVYGTLTVAFHSQPLSGLWGSIGGYAGALLVLLAVAGLQGKSPRRGLRLLLLAWILLAWAKSFGVQPVAVLMNHIPLLRQTSFLRYSPPSWELALIILAAFALDDFRDSAPVRRWAFSIVLALLGIGAALAWPRRAFWHRAPNEFLSTLFLLWTLSVVWALSGLFVAALAWTKLHGERRRVALAFLLVIDAAVLFMAPLASSSQGLSIDTRAVEFLRDHQGLSRNYSLGPLQPNYSAYYEVASIDHNVLPVPRLWADYGERNLLPGIWTRFGGTTFWPGVYGDGAGEAALSRNVANYRNLGVRYIITNSGASPAPTVLIPNQATLSKAGFRLAIAHWSNSVAGNPHRPALERAVARAAMRINHAPQPAGGERPAFGDLVLGSGQSLQLSMPAPAPTPSGSPIAPIITSIGVAIDVNSAPPDGDLEVQICAGTICRSGRRSLSVARGDLLFQVSLEQPIAAPAGMPLRITFTHEGGKRLLALRLEADAGETGEKVITSDGVIVDHALQLAFEYGQSLQGIRKVYADSLMDIWELPNPAPYFQVVQGGPCALSEMQREGVTAECSAPATLLRRELYMPGWKVRVNGAKATPVQQQSIFQSAVLPAGFSRVRYRFAPPYVDLGWAASLLGMAGLLWMAVLVASRRSFRVV